MNKLKAKLDGALEAVRMTDELKGAIIAMTEQNKPRKTRRWIPILVAACLALAIGGVAVARPAWNFVSAPERKFDTPDGPLVVKGTDYFIAQPEDNRDNIEALLEDSGIGVGDGTYADIYFDTLKEASEYAGVDMYESDVLTPCVDDCPYEHHPIIAPHLTRYNIHVWRFLSNGETWIYVSRDYHAPNGDWVDVSWRWGAAAYSLSYPSEEGLEVKYLTLTSDNGLTASLVTAYDAGGSGYLGKYDREAQLDIKGYGYSYNYYFRDYSYADSELADLCQQILDSLPGKN